MMKAGNAKSNEEARAVAGTPAQRRRPRERGAQQHGRRRAPAPPKRVITRLTDGGGERRAGKGRRALGRRGRAALPPPTPDVRAYTVTGTRV